MEQIIMMRDSDGEQLVGDNAIITIRGTDRDGRRLSRKGNWFEDGILELMGQEVRGLHWYPEGNVFIDV